jgi:hypothetical protein
MALPLSAALFCIAYTLAPGHYPAGTGHAIAFAAFAEIPCIFLGVVYAEAVALGRRRDRYLIFTIGGLTLVLGALVLAFELTMALFATIGWLVVSYLALLWGDVPDPKLARDRARGEMRDKLDLFGLIPVFVIGALLLAMFLGGLALLFEVQIFGPAPPLPETGVAADQDSALHWLASIPATYSLCSAAIIGHGYSERFTAERKRLLDRRWVERLTRSSRPANSRVRPR